MMLRQFGIVQLFFCCFLAVVAVNDETGATLTATALTQPGEVAPPSSTYRWLLSTFKREQRATFGSQIAKQLKKLFKRKQPAISAPAVPPASSLVPPPPSPRAAFAPLPVQAPSLPPLSSPASRDVTPTMSWTGPVPNVNRTISTTMATPPTFSTQQPAMAVAPAPARVAAPIVAPTTTFAATSTPLESLPTASGSSPTTAPRVVTAAPATSRPVTPPASKGPTVAPASPVTTLQTLPPHSPPAASPMSSPTSAVPIQAPVLIVPPCPPDNPAEYSNVPSMEPTSFTTAPTTDPYSPTSTPTVDRPSQTPSPLTPSPMAAPNNPAPMAVVAPVGAPISAAQAPMNAPASFLVTPPRCSQTSSTTYAPRSSPLPPAPVAVAPMAVAPMAAAPVLPAPRAAAPAAPVPPTISPAPNTMTPSTPGFTVYPSEEAIRLTCGTPSWKCPGNRNLMRNRWCQTQCVAEDQVRRKRKAGWRCGEC